MRAVADQGAPDMALLTALQAAAILGVDPKTFRSMNAPFIVAGRSRRYTRTLLQQWLERSVRQCQQTQESPPARLKGGKSPGKNTSGAAPGRRSGKSRSESNIIEFEKVAGLRID